MAEEPFIHDSNQLRDALLEEAKRLTDEIDKLERTTDAHTAYYGYLKDFLVNSGCLCDDIVRAIFNDAVLLAMIGTRALLEDAINAHYLEAKPSESERMAVAADWFRLSNDPEAYKNKLDNKRVDQRAEAAGKDTKAMHDSEYVDFCHYTHGTAARSILNVPSHRTLIAKKAALASLKAYANIVTSVARIVSETTPKELMSAVTDYLDKYRNSVTEAPLPKLDNNKP